MFRDFNEGELLLIDKPYTWTSQDVVKKVKFACRAKKVGHAGTLDPLATGLLILCTGKWTKRVDEYQAQEKEYEGTLVLGATRPSHDLETEVNAAFDISGITEAQVREAATRFVGEIEQTPPAFSAVKVNGKRAYEKARAGEEVTIKSKKIVVTVFEITRVAFPEVDFRIVCSKGTYIRTLVSDLGAVLNNGAYMSRLVRTRIGELKLQDAWQLDELVNKLKELSAATNENIQES